MFNRMLFPQYGRVVILDDKLEQVKGLISVLSKHAIAFTCLEAVPDDYEDLNSLGIRIIFLDLVLGTPTDEKSVKSTLFGALTSLIKNDNGPYVIAVWSTQQEHYQNVLNELKKELPNPPDEIIRLEKSKYKDYSDELEDELEKDFEKVFKECSLLQFISVWENAINQSAIEVTADFNRLLPKSKNARGGLYAGNLARLMLANKLDKNLTNKQKLSAAFEGLNVLLNKKANHNIQPIVDLTDSIVTIPASVSKADEEDVNTLLWMAEAYSYKAPKNVYRVEKSESITKAFKNSVADSNDNIFVEIDITHKCSFVQNKTDNTGHQFVKAILFAEGNYKNEQGAHLTKVGTIKYNDHKMTLIVFLGEIINKSETGIDETKAIFSVSDEVYSEIRAALGGLYIKSGKLEL